MTCDYLWFNCDRHSGFKTGKQSSPAVRANGAVHASWRMEPGTGQKGSTDIRIRPKKQSLSPGISSCFLEAILYDLETCYSLLRWGVFGFARKVLPQNGVIS